MEILQDNVIKLLETASARSIGLAMAALGLTAWWLVTRIKNAGNQAPAINSQVKEHRAAKGPRRRLPLRAYHR
ncbi:MAG: hypothetical protein O3B73_10395 [bacterium]|jgi:hypothetical protein|nr:hypothetical protein [bacterium]